MWQLLTGAASIQAAYETLLAEYDVDAGQLRQDMQDLIEKLVAAHLLELCDA